MDMANLNQGMLHPHDEGASERPERSPVVWLRHVLDGGQRSALTVCIVFSQSPWGNIPPLSFANIAVSLSSIFAKLNNRRGFLIPDAWLRQAKPLGLARCC